MPNAKQLAGQEMQRYERIEKQLVAWRIFEGGKVILMRIAED